MEIVRFSDPNFIDRVEAAAAASSLFDPVIEQRTQAILSDVRTRGDQALVELTEKFDGPRLTPDQLPVSTAEILDASIRADPSLRQAVQAAGANIAAFARNSLRKPWSSKNTHGARVGEKFDPFQRVGVYIPGGTAPLVSTALMTLLLAREAGCPEIVVCTPARKDGSVHPGLLFAAKSAGATEIYRVGGSQAIAAMALGTPTIPRVQKIFGPGNAYVVTAKRLVFGLVAIDLLPGPSEVLVVADDSANPAFIAADMLAQAEHGSGHERVWFVSPSATLIGKVQKELERQVAHLSRASFIQKVLETGTWLFHVKDLAQAALVVNRLAPEHCEILTRNPRALAAKIHTAGALFLGPFSPTVLGDYVAGPSHTLPTGGAGASFAGLTVDQFQRRTSVVEYTRGSLKRGLKTVEAFAAMEGLDAHARSASIRLEGAAPKRARTVDKQKKRTR